MNIDLDELQKAKDLIDRINSVDLSTIMWERNGKPVLPPKVEWRKVGLTNTNFAYEYLLLPTDEKYKYNYVTMYAK